MLKNPRGNKLDDHFFAAMSTVVAGVDCRKAVSEEEICAGSCAGIAYFYSPLGIWA